MSNAEFQDRLQRLQARKVLDHILAAPPPLPKAANRRERLDLALHHLAQIGITGNRAYAPVWRRLARLGLIVRPFHFWPFIGLCLMGFLIFLGATALLFWMAMVLEVTPRPLRGMLRAGPQVVLAGIAGMSVIWAAVHWFQARSHNLPRWRDL